MNFAIIKHVYYETPGLILEWLSQNGHTFENINLYQEVKFPTSDSFDHLIIMGGPMGVYDEIEFPWLKKEKQFIAECLKSNKKALGICLGAQLLADVMGAKIKKNNCEEIGWYELKECKGILGHLNNKKAFHWHGDTFELPTDTELLASSEFCENQAFYNDQVLGLQFHLEINDQLISNINEFLPKTGSEDSVQTPEEILSQASNLQMELNKVLDEFFTKN